MEIGNEISQKIRSAIKAKLVDLGVYVDDELPDYIMVMVANKKSQAQMTDDLNLFLGNNTEKFTSWLHALLQKLQSITADPPKPPDAPLNAQSENYDSELMQKETSELEEDELLIGPEHDDFEEEANREREAAAAQGVLATALMSEQPPAAPPPAGTGGPGPARRAPQLLWSSRSGTSSRGSSRRLDHSPPSDVRSRLGSGGRSLEKASEYTLQKQRAAVRKRRAPESVVGSIVRHDVEEEQYDPRRPLIGRVASTVRVGERRPTLPPSQQANKTLLLKAMTEAANSINRDTQRLTEQIAVEEEAAEQQGVGMEERGPRRGTDRGRDRDRDRERDRERERTGDHRYGRAGGRARVEPRGLMRSAGSLQRITRLAPYPGPEAHRHDGSDAADRSVQLYSRSKREEVLQQFRAGLNSDSEDALEQDFAQSSPPRPQPPRPQPSYEHVGLDNRHVHVSSPTGHRAQDTGVVEEEEQRTITMATPEQKGVAEGGHLEAHLDTLIESGAEESDFTDEESALRIVQEKQPEPLKPRPESPKFVVTLDGVDPATMTGSGGEVADSEMDMQVEEGSPKQATIVRVAPQRIATSTPLSMMSSLSIDFNESDYYMEDDGISGGIPSKRNRGVERCKFWLACRNGNQCPFHHPSVPCKMFPKCKFGDKCLYIHPNCRFDGNCTRANCPFTHATKRPSQPSVASALMPAIQPFSVMSTPTPFGQPYASMPTQPAAMPGQAPAQTTCRFFPKCTNMNCKYLHPKPCRYGVSCRDKASCAFTHPELPPANKLRWSAPKVNRSLTDNSATIVR